MYQHAFLVSLLPLVAAHGFLASPPARRPGTAYRATCGEQPFYQQSADINGNVQGIQQVVGSDKTAACNLWLCKGFQFDDNKSNVQSYSLGQTIDIKATIAAPHTGYANVSVVKTSTNTMIGTPLIEFQNYASNNGVAANNTAFSVTLPSSLGGECTTAGDCVLQWFWDAPSIDQTYEACVDFVVGGSGSGSAPASSAAQTKSAAATSVQSPATSAATSAAETSVKTSVPIVTSATAVATTSAAAAPATSTAVPATGDDECPAGDGEDDSGDDEGAGDDDECPADDGEDDGSDEGDDEECPADGEDAGEASPTSTTSFIAKDFSTTAAAATVHSTSIVTLVLTSTVTTERVVTVTAAATACN